MEAARVQATVRDKFGKGPSRRLRSTASIPAVLYGKGTETTPLSVSPKQLSDALATEFGPNRIIELEIDGKGTEKALVAEHQVHPVTRSLLHADFRRIDDATKVSVRVPLRLVGKAKGIVLGGVLSQVFRTLPVRCLPAHIPSSIECDVSDLDIEQSVAVRDLALPEGVEVTLSPTQTIGGVYGKRKVEEEEEAKTEGAAAPAADAKKPEKK
jgi:large subunit ribosomal protein L25